MKKGIMSRRRSALERLEAARAEFIAAGEDRKPYISTRTDSKGRLRKINHPGRPFQKEVDRMNAEIAHLKELIR